MSKPYCLDIKFPDVDFSPHYIKGKKEVDKIHHAHLYVNLDKIELRIFYDDQTYFGDKLMNWANIIDWKKFGSFIKAEVTKNDINKRLKKVDFSEAKLLGGNSSTNYYEGNKKYIILRVDTVKLYCPPNEEHINTAEFYFDDSGFKVVEPFYETLRPKTLFQNDGKFEINRMENSRSFYKLGKSSFRPEFNFYSRNKRGDRSATIIKEPKIQFEYQSNITEEEAIKYGEIVLKISSFYHHCKINYQTCIIYLPEETITIKKVAQKTIETEGRMRAFGIHGDFNHFLQLQWQKNTIKNYKLLSKAINLFNQSLLLDINSSSSFLIYYNIIEICDKQKSDKVKFTHTLNKKQTKAKKDEALKTLLETIDIKEHKEFTKRWQNVQTLLQNKPMKNQLVSFLESQGLEPKTFPVNIKNLKELRDNITHGSIDKINVELLEKANTLLYRISGILILNLMGIKDWKLNTEIT